LEKLHNEELHNLHYKSSIITMIKSGRIRLAGHAAKMGKRGMHIGDWWESQKEGDQYQDQDVGGWRILKWVSKEIGWDGMHWTGLAQDRDQWRALVNKY
jgi:hypothetical protein